MITQTEAVPFDITGIPATPVDTDSPVTETTVTLADNWTMTMTIEKDEMVMVTFHL